MSLIAVVAAVLLAGCGDGRGSHGIAAVAGATPRPQRIAVSLGTATGGEGSAGIVLIDPSGRRIATLTTRKAGREDSEPAWAPDGSRLAFTRTTDNRRSFHIYVMRADGTGVHRVTSGRTDFSPDWSPDGRWIAYRANTALGIVHPDGTGRRIISTPSPTFADYPTWAPGGRIAYSYWDMPASDWPEACHQATRACGWVVSQRLDGTNRRRVVHGRDARWSGDGTAIVYTGPDGGVFSANASGGASRRLSRGFLADWSRDDTQIVYTRMGTTYADDTVWIMNRDGSNPHRILRGGADPAWRP